MKVEYTPRDTQALLKITPLKIEDEANYKCEITYLEVRENCDVVQIIKLTTLVVPDSIRIFGGNGEKKENSSTLGPLQEGSHVELTCEASGGKPMPIVTWYNGTEKIKGTYSSQENDDGLWTGISKLQMALSRGDLGARYECRVESAALDRPIISRINVDVDVKPTQIRLSGVENHVVNGTNVLLKCEVSGAKPAAEVKWYNGSTPITSKEYIKISYEAQKDLTYTTKSSLEFVASRFENGMNFKCYADNSVMREQVEPGLGSEMILEVYYPPVVTVHPASIVLVRNETGVILLHCNYISNPMKLEGVVWSKDGENLTLMEHKYDGGDTTNPSLKIVNLTKEDTGNYTCICANSVGSEKSNGSIFVDVQYPPNVEVNMEPKTPIKAIDRGNVTLFCTVITGNPTNLIKVRWFLGNELLRELPECNYTSYDENGDGEGNGGPLCGIDPSILILENVTESFAGDYTCQGENIAGWGPESDPQELIVYYPPSPAKLRYTPSKVIKMASVTLHCSVDNPGRPEEISYLWYRGSHQVQDITTSNWTITPVTLETKTNFTCIATNKGGNSSPATVFIDVQAPPAFIQNLPPYRGVLMSSKNISLTCRVECSPNCTITWLKDKRELDTDNHNLYYSESHSYPPDLQKNDFESIESTLMWNMTAWPGEQLDRTALNSNYTCQSSFNSVGNGVNSTIQIGVDYPPENLTVSNRVISVVENYEPEEIACSGKGHPKLSYTWRREGTTEHIAKSHMLKLRKVTKSHSGQYICEATNRYGSESTSVYLDVLYIPDCKLEKLEEYKGSQALLCTARANPQNVTFSYQIKGENESLDLSEMTVKGLKSYLKLDSVIDTERTYQCFVNNSVGKSAPCERDVAASGPWWKVFADENLIILIAVIVGIIICVIVICIIIILVCRRKRANNKYNNPVEMEEREKPDGQSPDTSGQSKWPLKPGVLVHSSKLRNININQLPSLHQFKTASLPKAGNRFIYKRNRNKLYARLERLREYLGFKDEERLPLGVYSGSSGVVTFKKLNASSPNLSTEELRPMAVSRKRKKPGGPPNRSSTGDKGGLGSAPPDGGLADPQNDMDRGFYENLPFHGMQNPPNKPISIITPMRKTNVPQKPIQSTAPNNSNVYPSPNKCIRARGRLERNQSFPGFQSPNCMTTRRRQMLHYNPHEFGQLVSPSFASSYLTSYNYSDTLRKNPYNISTGVIRANPDFLSQATINNSLSNLQNCHAKGTNPNYFAHNENSSEQLSRVVGRNEDRLDCRINSDVNRQTFNEQRKDSSDVGNSSTNSLRSTRRSKVHLRDKFGSLEIPKHRCYSPTFYSMRCRMHANRRPLVYRIAVPKRRTVSCGNCGQNTKEVTSKECKQIQTDEVHQNIKDSTEEQSFLTNEQYEVLTDSVHILEENSGSIELNIEIGPVPAPRCKKHKSSVIYANISGVHLDNSNNECEVSTTEVEIHKTQNDMKQDEVSYVSLKQNGGDALSELAKIALKMCENRVDSSSPDTTGMSNDITAQNLSAVSTRNTPPATVTSVFRRPQVESPKDALHQMLHEKIKTTSAQTKLEHVTSSTGPDIKAVVVDHAYETASPYLFKSDVYRSSFAPRTIQHENIISPDLKRRPLPSNDFCRKISANSQLSRSGILSPNSIPDKTAVSSKYLDLKTQRQSSALNGNQIESSLSSDCSHSEIPSASLSPGIKQIKTTASPQLPNSEPQRKSLSVIPKMPLLDLEQQLKWKTEIINTNQNAFYTLTTPRFNPTKHATMHQQYSATIPHQKHNKLIPRSLFHEQQLNKSKSFSTKSKPKKHFQIPLQKCHSFKFQTAESYFQPIKNIHEENLMKNGYVSDLGPNYPESHRRAHKREKHKYKGPLVIKRPSNYQENIQFQENMQNSVQLQYPQPIIGRNPNGKSNGIVYADLDMHSSSNKKVEQDAASSLSKAQKAKAKTEYATLQFNDVGQEIDV